MCKVLLMEDDPDQAALLVDVLEMWGHQVCPTTGADDTLTALRAERFDVVITDVFIPPNDENAPQGGIVLVSRIRTPRLGVMERWDRAIPIFAISGAFDRNRRNDFANLMVSLGADRCFSKPVDLNALKAALDDLEPAHPDNAAGA